MLRTSLVIGLALCIGGSWATAQDSGLPAPPKPPKSKAKEAEKAGDNSPSDGTPSPGPTAGTDERGHRSDLPRPRRIRIDVPFFHMDLNLGGRGATREAMPYRESPPVEAAPKGEAAPTPRAEEIPAPASSPAPAGQGDAAPRDGQGWRYRWHDGRWWYWMPSERWVYWDGGRWNDVAQVGRRLGIRNLRGLEGLNLKDLMQSDQIRIGQPRRGNIELEFEGIPPVNFGF